MDMYENLADENVSVPNNPPVMQFSGEEAAKIMQTLLSEDSDATEIFASLSGPGRPNSKKGAKAVFKSVFVYLNLGVNIFLALLKEMACQIKASIYSL